MDSVRLTTVQRHAEAEMGHRVGGDVDYRCTRCKMELAHTILAMVNGVPARVRCNTCHTDRKYRSSGRTARPATRRRTSSKSSAPSPSSDSEQQTKWRAAMAKAESQDLELVDYDMRQTFELEQLILHRKFGPGLVLGKVDNKIRVYFREGEKFLIHGR